MSLIAIERDFAVRADANVRISKYSAMIKSTVLVSTYSDEFAALPTAQNQGPVIGVTSEHFFEPNYFFKQGTDPSTVTGTAPLTYNLQAKPVRVRGAGGLGWVYAAGAVNQGDTLVVADSFGRVNNTANLGISAGTKIFPVGVAQTKTTAVNDLVLVALDFLPTTA